MKLDADALLNSSDRRGTRVVALSWALDLLGEIPPVGLKPDRLAIEAIGMAERFTEYVRTGRHLDPTGTPVPGAAGMDGMCRANVYEGKFTVWMSEYVTHHGETQPYDPECVVDPERDLLPAVDAALQRLGFVRIDDWTGVDDDGNASCTVVPVRAEGK